jgi:hypothetical protein
MTIPLSEFATDMLNLGKTFSIACTQANKDFIPTFVLLKDTKILPMPLPYYTKDRAFNIAVMKAVIADSKADAFAFIMEAWFSNPPPGTKLTDDFLRPSQDPNRKECLIVHAGNRSGEEILYCAEIKRRGHKLAFSEPENMAEKGIGKSMMALMSNMFGTEKMN